MDIETYLQTDKSFTELFSPCQRPMLANKFLWIIRDHPGMNAENVTEYLHDQINVKRYPTDLEKELKDKVDNNFESAVAYAENRIAYESLSRRDKQRIKPASPKQISFLQSLSKSEPPKGISIYEASRMIDSQLSG